MIIGALVAGGGLTLRLWAISWIGPRARTHSLDPPEVRITGGPYRFRHPLYIANIVVAIGLGVACSPSLTVLTVGVVGVVVFYALLMLREEREFRVNTVLEGHRPRTSWVHSLRTERSTWLTFAGCLGVLGLKLL
jgi:protein-S-isoprenylcysteine O-methyltransferase Ste14